jgi:hypothetical protein
MRSKEVIFEFVKRLNPGEIALDAGVSVLEHFAGHKKGDVPSNVNIRYNTGRLLRELAPMRRRPLRRNYTAPKIEK